MHTTAFVVLGWGVGGKVSKGWVGILYPPIPYLLGDLTLPPEGGQRGPEILYTPMNRMTHACESIMVRSHCLTPTMTLIQTNCNSTQWHCCVVSAVWTPPHNFLSVSVSVSVSGSVNTPLPSVNIEEWNYSRNCTDLLSYECWWSGSCGNRFSVGGLEINGTPDVHCMSITPYFVDPESLLHIFKRYKYFTNLVINN